MSEPTAPPISAAAVAEALFVADPVLAGADEVAHYYACLGEAEAAMPVVLAVWPLAVAEGRRQAAEAIERPDSALCDCPREDSTPTNPESGVEMDHHCDCAAVEAAAMMLRSYSATQHGQQCVHGTTMDEFYANGGDG